MVAFVNTWQPKEKKLCDVNDPLRGIFLRGDFFFKKMVQMLAD